MIWVINLFVKVSLFPEITTRQLFIEEVAVIVLAKWQSSSVNPSLFSLSIDFWLFSDGEMVSIL